MRMQVLTFLAIAISCVVGACIHVRSLAARRASAAPAPRRASPRPVAPSLSYNDSCYLDYVASGTSAINQRKYRFRICKVSGEYRAYIERSPSYRNRSTDLHSTHRHYDGQHYVCWSLPVRSCSGMAKIAKDWAEGTQRYIESGAKF